jgi:hypothetical protein
MPKKLLNNANQPINGYNTFKKYEKRNKKAVYKGK